MFFLFCCTSSYLFLASSRFLSLPSFINTYFNQICKCCIIIIEKYIFVSIVCFLFHISFDFGFGFGCWCVFFVIPPRVIHPMWNCITGCPANLPMLECRRNQTTKKIEESECVCGFSGFHDMVIASSSVINISLSTCTFMERNAVFFSTLTWLFEFRLVKEL